MKTKVYPCDLALDGSCPFSFKPCCECKPCEAEPEEAEPTAQDRINEATERPRDRLRLIFVVGDYLNLSRAAYRDKDKARLEKTAKALGVTTADLIQWYLND